MKIVKKNLTIENIKAIKLIDDDFYKDTRLTLKWYLKRYNKHNVAFFLTNKKEVVGYIAIANIKKILYDQIKGGYLKDDIAIDADLYDTKSKYHYISSVVIKEPYQKLGYGSTLLDHAINECKSNIVVITISLGGYNLIKKRMLHIMKIDDNTNIFEYKGEIHE